MGNAVLKKISVSVLAVLILIFVAYQAFRSSSYSKIKTDTAMYATMWYSVEAEAFAVRDEEMIEGEYEGNISFAVDNGNKVSSGGVLANVFSGEREAQAYTEMKSIEEKINMLERLNAMKDTYRLSPALYEEKIRAELIKIQNSILSNDFSLLTKLKQELVSFMNQKDVASGNAPDFSEEIAKLTARYNELKAISQSEPSKIHAPFAGYFISGTDGYENAVSFSDVLNVTPDALNSIESRKEALNKNTVGRICKDHNWYIVFNVALKSAEEFEKACEQERTVYIKFPFASMEKVAAAVCAVNKSEKEAAVVLKCDYMNSQLASIRKEKIEVQLYNYEGIAVGTNAVHFANIEETVKDENGNESTVLHENVQGVYIVDGAELRFVQIIPKATINGYVVCKITPDENDTVYTNDTINLYDEVVISGKDLYDGKLIE